MTIDEEMDWEPLEKFEERMRRLYADWDEFIAWYEEREWERQSQSI